ncbi:MAG: prepilin-type N-terminal cleavage/methylation domain-containing protein [Gemmatimonadota bacterium]|nr:prepilin-type N-terminal cleavage/methylation domain-containing protein [Gemmatimonadota bacterium]
MRIHAGRAGFTLIELLIVIVVIGVLAAIAIPKFAVTKERSYLATMKSDLHNLISVQEGYLSDNAAYYAGGIPDPSLVYRPSSGTTVTMVAATTSGWQATATYTGTAKTCALFYGNIGAIAPANVNGEPKCT